MRKKYSTDLTDEQWEEIKPFGRRNRKWSKRELLDAVFYLVDSGCKWRQLPHDTCIYCPQFLSSVERTLGQNFATHGKSN